MNFQEYDVEDLIIPLQPSLNYTAPELVRSKTSSVGCSSDIFSFGCLAYHLIARKPLLDCHNNVKMVLANVVAFCKVMTGNCMQRPDSIARLFIVEQFFFVVVHSRFHYTFLL